MHTQNKKVATLITVLTAVAIIISSCGGTDKSQQTGKLKTDTALKQATAKPENTGRLLGAWHDEAIKTDKGEQIAYELVSKGSKLYIQAITFTGNDLKLNDIPPVSPSASEIKKQGDSYIGVERPEEKYKIDKTGNLLIYDGTQLVATCKKLISLQVQD